MVQVRSISALNFYIGLLMHRMQSLNYALLLAATYTQCTCTTYNVHSDLAKSLYCPSPLCSMYMCTSTGVFTGLYRNGTINSNSRNCTMNMIFVLYNMHDSSRLCLWMTLSHSLMFMLIPLNCTKAPQTLPFISILIAVLEHNTC